MLFAIVFVIELLIAIVCFPGPWWIFVMFCSLSLLVFEGFAHDLTFDLRRDELFRVNWYTRLVLENIQFKCVEQKNRTAVIYYRTPWTAWHKVIPHSTNGTRSVEGLLKFIDELLSDDNAPIISIFKRKDNE